MISIRQNWIHSSFFDSIFILLPSFLSVLFVMSFSHENSLPLWMWVVFVMGIDVAHVYSTLFKTYFHSEEFKAKKKILLMIPITVWLTGIIFYSFGQNVFWTILAYLAVFHFIRQQYGFMKLYSREDSSVIDHLMIYAATLYPIIYWHTHPREFSWFMEDDFFQGMPLYFERISFFIYAVIIFMYLIKEIRHVISTKEINVPKNLIVLGTALSWYIGIVHYNGDIAFTVTNVVSHGIPYMALIWSWGRKNQTRHFDRPYGVFLFVICILMFAYFEEGMWAGFVWREHLEVFNIFSQFPAITDTATLSWLVPLLTLPQATHYVLDGFIWKRNGKGP